MSHAFRTAVSMALLSCAAPPSPALPGMASHAASGAPSASPPTTVAEATDVRLPDGVAPKGYRLDLAVDPRIKQFAGHVEIDVAVAAPTSTLVLHGRDLDVRRAAVRVAGGAPIAATVSHRKAFGQKEGEDELVLSTAAPVPRGAATIDITYEADFGNLWGLYRTEVDGHWYAFTQLEAIDARRMFPCFDEPVFKTPFELTVVVPKGMVAVSNTSVLRTEREDDRERVVFEKTKPLPTYLVALAVGDLSIDKGPTVPTPIRIVATAGRASRGHESTDTASKALTALEHEFGIPYPYPKLDIAAVPDFGPGAMENAGLVTFREDLLLSDGVSSAQARRRQRYVIAHELAHQWFGDLVTMGWWDDPEGSPRSIPCMARSTM